MVDYDYKISYRKGSSNVVVDAPSRIPQMELEALTVYTSGLLERIKYYWLQVAFLIHLMRKLKQGSTLIRKYSWQNR